MLQRNVSGSPLSCPDIPALVQPNGEVEWDKPLAGFEAVQPTVPEPKSPPKSKTEKPSAADEAKEASK